MPSWEVRIERISVQTMTVKDAPTEADAIKQAHAASEEERGPECVDWNYEAAEIETVEEDE